jgi:hypothetical protein
MTVTPAPIDAPTIAEVRAWVGVSVASLSDEQLQQIIDTESALQAAACAWLDTYPTALRQALLRRCGREIGGRQLPLGLTADTAGEYAPVRLPSYDVEIERLEAPWRVIAVA